MNIGFDIDGPLFNQEKFQLKKGIKYLKKKYIKDYFDEYKIKLKKSDVDVLDITSNKTLKGKEINLNKHYIKINPNGYGVKEIFNCSKKEEEKFWYKYMPLYALFTPFRKDVIRVIKQLHSEGNKIFFVTARAKANEDNLIGNIQKFLVEIRLKMRKIPYEKIVYCSYKEDEEIKDKINACMKYDLDLMIEDKKGNVEAIENQTKTKSFLYATRSNQDIKDKKIKRCVNHSQLYNEIRKYKEPEQFNVLHKEEKEKMPVQELKDYYESYRDYLKKHVYDTVIVKKREENLKKLIKNGKYVFDHFVKHTVINNHLIPKEDGIIITTNHRDMLDIPLVMRAIGDNRPYHAMLKSEFLDTVAEGFLTNIGCEFINRNDKSIREQAREIGIKRVLSGSNLIICPEGTRNKTDELLLKFDFGAVSIAQNAGRKIYPCAIYKNNNHKVINFGKPIEVDITDNLEEANQKLFNVTAELLKESKKITEENSQDNSSSKKPYKVKRIVKK